MNNKTQIIASVTLFTLFGFLGLGSIDENKKSRNKMSNSTQTEMAVPEEKSNPEKDLIIDKLKARARRDWPNDYTTQEFWVNQQIEDYDYMLEIEDNSIKRQAQRDWPLDFSTQKFWYNEQIEARQRINQ